MKTYSIYETEWGVGALIFSEKGLAGLLFPRQDIQDLNDEISRRFELCLHVQKEDYGLSSSLARYFKGEQKYFDIPVDFGRTGVFERCVLENLRCIPYGDMVTYKDLAVRCGQPRAARAVGNALRKNPIPIVVPCHRVVRSDGSIGGWSGAPGWKERLLAIEDAGRRRG